MHRIPCPQCGNRLKYLDQHVGKRARCQKCGLAFVIPPPGTEEMPLDPFAEPSADLVPLSEAVETVVQIPPVPRWKKIDLPVFTGYCYFLFGVLNCIVALVVLVNGSEGCGRGPVVVIADDGARAAAFYSVSALFLLANGALVALGYLFKLRTKAIIWIGIVALGLLIFAHAAYWVTLNLVPIGILECSLLGLYIWLGVVSVNNVAQTE